MSQLPPELTAELMRRIVENDLEPAAEYIVDNAAECYAIVADGRDDYSETGHTRLGGDPDLPAGFPWPCDGDPDDPASRFSNFVAQINFAELPPLGSTSPLPRCGILYLFVKHMESAAQPVLLDTHFFEGDRALLRRTSSPENARLQDDDLADLEPQRIRAMPAISLPTYRRDFERTVRGLINPGKEDFAGRWLPLLDDLVSEDQIGQILGFANVSGEEVNLYRQLHLARIGKRHLAYYTDWDSLEEYGASMAEWQKRGGRGIVKMFAAMRKGVSWLVDHRETLAAGIAEWRLLCQINSNNAMGLCINDCDPLYTFIRDEDLAKRNFSDMAAEVTQG